MNSWVLVREKRSWVPDWLFTAIFRIIPTWCWPMRQILTRNPRINLVGNCHNPDIREDTVRQARDTLCDASSPPAQAARVTHQMIVIFGEGLWRVQREGFSEGYQIYSGMLLCPICRTKWAELQIYGDHVYEPRMVSCVACDWSDDLHPVPGSLLPNDTTSSGVDWALLDVLPAELLRREFDLTLKAYFKEPQCPPSLSTAITGPADLPTTECTASLIAL